LGVICISAELEASYSPILKNLLKEYLNFLGEVFLSSGNWNKGTFSIH
jgi:hypothetical protein